MCAVAVRRVSDLTELSSLGLYLNDLNLHGLSREMVMEGWHQCARLELLCERAEQHSSQLQDSLRLLDQWRARSDHLLYSMIPRSVADRLLAGHSAMDTCQVSSAHSTVSTALANRKQFSHVTTFAITF